METVVADRAKRNMFLKKLQLLKDLPKPGSVAEAAGTLEQLRLLRSRRLVKSTL